MKSNMQPFIDRNELEIYLNVGQVTAVRGSMWGDYTVIEINGQTYEVMNSLNFVLESIVQGNQND